MTRINDMQHQYEQYLDEFYYKQNTNQINKNDEPMSYEEFIGESVNNDNIKK